MTKTVNTSDPSVYLTNGTRNVLGLEGVSDAPQSVVQAAQEAFKAKTGQWPYVQGMPNKAGTTPDPKPDPEPEALGKAKPRR